MPGDLVAAAGARSVYSRSRGPVQMATVHPARQIRLAMAARADLWLGGRLILDRVVHGVVLRKMCRPRPWGAEPMTRDIESIDGLSPKEAVRQGKVKRSPYVVRGRKYYPMTLKQAAKYREVGTSSWYGNETLRQKGGHMTANGEAFDPGKPTAAHKLLPLPTHVRVTNLENGRSMTLRLNHRGPFVKGRIIDLSAGAAKQLGFYRNGTARVRVETVEL